MSRPSLYLQNKCEALESVINFFLSGSGGRGRTVEDKRLVFLGQLDFWDWEMDELIYSIQSFGERSAAWDSVEYIKNNIAQLGLPVIHGKLKKIGDQRLWNRHMPKQEVVAPIEALNKLIGKWNSLIKLCEETLLLDKEEIETAQKLGAQLISNLSKYQKYNVAQAT